MTDPHYVRPQAAYNLLKNAQAVNQTVYLYAPTGSGKTALITDYLGRQEYRYYSSATGSPSEIDLPAKVNQASPTIVVMDDLQELNSHNLYEDYYPLIEQMAQRRDIWLVLVARCPIAKWLRALSVQHAFITIDSRQLWFTRREQDAYLEKWGLTISERFRARLYEQATGYPLVLSILARQLAQDGIPEQEVAVRASLELWDYLETYVYDRWDPELLDFLMDLTVVKEFDLEMARQITHKNDAARLLSQAMETGDFLWLKTRDGRQVYKMGRIMRESLGRRLERTHGAEHVRELYNNAGAGYELAGRAPDALNLYKRCGNDDAILRVLTENARKNVTDGCYYALRDYYMSLSEERIRQSADLMSAMSLLYAILMNREESERWYGELRQYAQTSQGGSRRYAEGQMLYLDLALPYGSIEQIPELLHRLEEAKRQRCQPVRELALTAGMPSVLNGARDFCEWTRNDRKLAEELRGLLEYTMGKYGKGLADIVLAESLMEKGAESRELSLLISRGKLQAQNGRPELLFVASAILVRLSLLNGHEDDARHIMDSWEQQVISAPWLHPNTAALRCRLEMYGGHVESVRDWLTTAPDENDTFCTLDCYRYLTKIRAYIMTGSNESAMYLLQQLLCCAEEMERTYLMIESTLLYAIVQHRLGYRDWVVALQQAIDDAQEYHFVRVLSQEGAALRPLLLEHEFNWQDEDYRDQVMEECRRMAENYPAYLKEHTNRDIQLPERAIKILKLQAEGMSVDQIASVMCLSKAGVKYYNQESYKKLGVSSKAAAVAEAQKRGLI